MSFFSSVEMKLAVHQQYKASSREEVLLISIVISTRTTCNERVRISLNKSSFSMRSADSVLRW